VDCKEQIMSQIVTTLAGSGSSSYDDEVDGFGTTFVGLGYNYGQINAFSDN
jgi:hypothetical protein